MEYKVFTDRNISRDIYELEVEGKRVLMFYFQRTIPTLGLNQSQVGDYLRDLRSACLTYKADFCDYLC